MARPDGRESHAGGRWPHVRRNCTGTPADDRMNRTLPARDCSRRSADPSWASGLAGSVPGAGRLELRVAAHSGGRAQIATGAPRLAHVCAARGITGDGTLAVRRKRKAGKQDRDLLSRIARSFDPKLPIASLTATAQSIPLLVSGVTTKKPAAAVPGGLGREGSMLFDAVVCGVYYYAKSAAAGTGAPPNTRLPLYIITGLFRPP